MKPRACKGYAFSVQTKHLDKEQGEVKVKKSVEANESGRRELFKVFGLGALASVSGALGSPFEAEAQGEKTRRQYSEAQTILELLSPPLLYPSTEETLQSAIEASWGHIPHHIDGLKEKITAFGGKITDQGNGNPPSISFFGWTIIVEKVRKRRLSGCINKPVTYWELKILHQEGSDEPVEVAIDAKLGAYRNRTGKLCLVFREEVYDICRTICNPTRSDLVGIFVLLLTIATIAAGLNIIRFIIIAFAVVAAIIYFPYLRELVKN